MPHALAGSRGRAAREAGYGGQPSRELRAKVGGANRIWTGDGGCADFAGWL